MLDNSMMATEPKHLAAVLNGPASQVACVLSSTLHPGPSQEGPVFHFGEAVESLHDRVATGEHRCLGPSRLTRKCSKQVQSPASPPISWGVKRNAVSSPPIVRCAGSLGCNSPYAPPIAIPTGSQGRGTRRCNAAHEARRDAPVEHWPSQTICDQIKPRSVGLRPGTSGSVERRCEIHNPFLRQAEWRQPKRLESSAHITKRCEGCWMVVIRVKDDPVLGGMPCRCLRKSVRKPIRLTCKA